MNDLLLPGWKRLTEFDIEKHHDVKGCLVNNYERIHRYPDTKSDYCWSVVRAGNRVRGIVYSMAAAYDECEKHQSMPIERFYELIKTSLMEDLARIYQQLVDIGCDVHQDEYQQGFIDGKRAALESCRRFIEGEVIAA